MACKYLLKFLRAIITFKDFEEIRLDIFKRYLERTDEIPSLNSIEQSGYLCLTYDTLVASTAMERTIIEEIKHFDCVENYFSALQQYQEEHPIEIATDSISDYHFSLGHMVDMEKAKLFLSAVAVKELRKDNLHICRNITEKNIQSI